MKNIKLIDEAIKLETTFRVNDNHIHLIDGIKFSRKFCPINDARGELSLFAFDFDLDYDYNIMYGQELGIYLNNQFLSPKLQSLINDYDYNYEILVNTGLYLRDTFNFQKISNVPIFLQYNGDKNFDEKIKKMEDDFYKVYIKSK